MIMPIRQSPKSKVELPENTAKVLYVIMPIKTMTFEKLT